FQQVLVLVVVMLRGGLLRWLVVAVMVVWMVVLAEAIPLYKDGAVQGPRCLKKTQLFKRRTAYYLKNGLLDEEWFAI
ncbi:hypothetical protein Hamer_G021147, partial [Homarus americanus]